MKKRILSWILALALLLSVCPMVQFGFVTAGAAATPLTTFSASAGTILSSGRYVVTSSQTITGNGGPGLKIADGATVLLYIQKNVTLTVTGAAGGNASAGNNATHSGDAYSGTLGSGSNGAGGGYAGIYVPSGATLIITGEGTLNATGGKGGNAGNGGNGGNGYAKSNSGSNRDSYMGPGGGGGGGAGGGGAGIGTNGANGGKGGNGGASYHTHTYREWSWGWKYRGDGDRAGIAGDAGSGGGSSAASGTVYRLGTVTVNATGGASGNAGTAGGGAGNYDYTNSTDPRGCAAGGSGGGSGGSGASGSGIGSGGYGGGGGGGGSSGGYWYSSGSSNEYSGGYGGAAGSNGGVKGTDAYNNSGKDRAAGGSGGGVGSKGTSGTYYNGTSVPAYAKTTVFLDLQNGTGGSTSVTATIGVAMPSATMPTRTGYTFAGYYASSNQTGTQYYKNTGASNHVWDGYKGDSPYDTIYACWTANTIDLTLNNQSATTAGTTHVYYKYNTNTYYNTNSNGTLSGAITSITVPTRAGYTFGGYYTQTGGGGTQYINASGSFVNNPYTAVSANTTLYAKWTANTIDLTLNNQSATSAGTTHVYYKYDTNTYYNTNSNGTLSGAITAITLPDRTGYIFGGYYTQANGGGTQYINESGSIVNNPYTAVTASTTLYAKWTAKTYGVTYTHTGDMTYDETNPTTATHDQGFTFKLKLLEGYDLDDPTFSAQNATIGSFTKNGSDVTVNVTNVTGPVTINTDPTANIYDLTFSGYGYTVTSIVPEDGKTPHHGNYKFTIKMDYGYTDAEPASVNATSSLNGHVTQITPVYLESESDPTNATYTYKIEDVKGNINVTVTPTHNIYTVNLSVDCDDGQGQYQGAQLSTTSANITYLDNFTFTVTLDEAHNQNAAAVTFNGETITGTKNGDVYTYTVQIKGPSEIIVTPVINQYEVKFFKEDGVTQIGETEMVKHGADATPPAAELKAPILTEHYHFDGWDGYTNVTEARSFTATFTAYAHTGGENNITCTTPGYCEDEECIAANGGERVPYQDPLGHIWETNENGAVLNCDPWDYSDPQNPSVREYRYCVREIRGEVCHYCDEETANVENGKVVATLEGSATCQSPGTTKYKATFDNPAFFSLVSEELDVEKIPHVYDNYVYNDDATCEADGTETGTCVMCGISKDVRTKEGTALGHKLADEVDYVWSADHTTCTATQYCVRYGAGGCDYKVTETATAQIHEDEVSCTETGDTTYTAVFENEAFETQVYIAEDTVLAKGHNEDHKIDEVITKEPSCTEKGIKTVTETCRDCGYQFSIEAETIPMLEHVEADEPVLISETEATCTAAGIRITATMCRNCGQTLNTVTEIVEAAKGHTPGDPVDETIRPATCSLAGLKKTVVKCTVCEGVLSEVSSEIPKLDHANTETTYETKPATCVAAKIETTIKTCTECGAVVSRTTETVGEPLGHREGTPTYETILEPTCVRNGQKRVTVKCERCEAVLSKTVEKIDKLGHIPETTEIEGSRIPSTCTVKGKYSYKTVCSRCEETLEEGEKELDLLPHTPSDEGDVSTVPSTCIKAGTKTTTYLCTECGNVAKTETETLPLADHLLEVVPEKAPTATEAGCREHFKCTVCGKLFGDSNAENELSSADVTIPATGDPGDPGDNPGDNGDNGGVGVCVCGKTHTGVFAWLITFLHRIVYFIRNLFK